MSPKVQKQKHVPWTFDVGDKFKWVFTRALIENIPVVWLIRETIKTLTNLFIHSDPTLLGYSILREVVIAKPVIILYNNLIQNERFWDIATDPCFTSSQLRESSERGRWGNSRSLIAHRRAASPRERTGRGKLRKRERERVYSLKHKPPTSSDSAQLLASLCFAWGRDK